MSSMKYIEIRNTDPHLNLAMEEYLLTNCRPDESYFLLWQNEPSIIIGKYQNMLEEINIKYVEEHKIQVVRRMSGGGAVYHDLGNINYSFIIGNGHQDLFDFRKFAYPIVELLQTYGVNAEVSGRNDMTICGKKISGSAQFIRNNNLLHHGTLLFNSDLDVLQKALNVSADKIVSKGIKSVRSRVTNIQENLTDKLELKEFWKQLSECIAMKNDPWEVAFLGEVRLREIQRLAAEKYNTWEWNYGTSPSFNYKNTKRFDGGKLEVLLNIQGGLLINCRFCGDFFSRDGLSEIEAKLIGVKYRKDEVRAALDRYAGSDLIMGISNDQIINTMFD